jgi:hypothetical protein
LKKLTSSPKDFFCPALDLPSSDEKQPTYRRRFSTQKPTRERERERAGERAERGVRKASSFFPNFAPQKKFKKKE